MVFCNILRTAADENGNSLVYRVERERKRGPCFTQRALFLLPAEDRFLVLLQNSCCATEILLYERSEKKEKREEKRENKRKAEM